VIKKTPGTANDFHFGLFVDPDIGYGFDDYVGCDTLTQSAFAYNGDSFDETSGGSTGYGTSAPMVSTTFLDKNMTAFAYFINANAPNGNPQISTDFHSIMQGYWRDGTAITYGGNGYGGTTPTKYMFPDNPILTSSSAWNETTANHTPGDRRYIQSSGGYTLNHLDTFTITYATIAHPTVGDYNIDNLVLPRINEVRLAYTDSIADGNTYFNPVGIADVTTTALRTYPNPVSNELTIDLNEFQQSQIQLIDLNGRVVFTQNSIKNTPTYSIDMSHLPNGVYFLHVVSNHKRVTQKVIKNSSL
jgi:hypothetical protein